MRINEHEHEHSGVQGVLTLNYDCYENGRKKEEITYASQLSAGDDNTVFLLEYHAEKGFADNLKEEKSSAKYKIDSGKLIALIKEHGEQIK